MNTNQPITYIVDDDTEIRPGFGLRFERLSSHSGRGLCHVDVSLKNTGTIVANYPFLCLTALGLKIGPAPGWKQYEVTIVRKMQRFTPTYIFTLEPDTEVHCCTITLRYKFNFGGCLEFEPGSEHLLSNFPNLNLICAVGAGNYPSKRVLLQVPATALRAIIEEQVEFMAATRV